jgi:crossover junction endodeoxyribonuclease RusA
MHEIAYCVSKDDSLNIQMPWPPSANRYWRYDGGRVHISDEARAYRALIAKLNLFWRIPCLKGRLSLRILAYPPDKRKRDIDNLCKITIDSLQKARVFLDDCQIDLLFIERKEQFKDGKLEVQIFEQ